MAGCFLLCSHLPLSPQAAGAYLHERLKARRAKHSLVGTAITVLRCGRGVSCCWYGGSGGSGRVGCRPVCMNKFHPGGGLLHARVRLQQKHQQCLLLALAGGLAHDLDGDPSAGGGGSHSNGKGVLCLPLT
jgi:hypothetical protein